MTEEQLLPETPTITPITPSPTMGLFGILALGVYFLMVSLLILYVLMAIWPSPKDLEAEPTAALILFGSIPLSISNEVRLLLIVVLAGALGSNVHSATSFATYVGNRQLKSSWVWWYLLRPFIGGSLALVVYFALRGGLISVSAQVKEISHFGMAAIAGMVGMFSKEATDKLHEMFQTLFNPAQQVPRADPLTGGGDPKGAERV